MNLAIAKNEKHRLISVQEKPKIIKKNSGIKTKFKTCNTHLELLVEYPCGRRAYMSRKEYESLI